MKKKFFCTLLISAMLLMSMSAFAKEKSEDVAFDGGGYGVCKIGITTYYAWAESISYKSTVDALSTRVTAYYKENGYTKGKTNDGGSQAQVSAETYPFTSASSYHMFEGRSYSMNIYQ